MRCLFHNVIIRKGKQAGAVHCSQFLLLISWRFHYLGINRDISISTSISRSLFSRGIKARRRLPGGMRSTALGKEQSAVIESFSPLMDHHQNSHQPKEDSRLVTVAGIICSLAKDTCDPDRYTEKKVVDNVKNKKKKELR